MAEELFCKQCGTKIDPDDRFCPECGSPVLTKPPYVSEPQVDTSSASAQPEHVGPPPTPPPRGPNQKYCTQCGEVLAVDADYCSKCGASQAPLRRSHLIRHRDWLAVCILSVVTLGIYYIYWLVKTKNEMVVLGADIPTAWLLIIPFVNFYFYWKYSEGAQYISSHSVDGVLLFILFIVFFPAAIYLTQKEINRHAYPSY
jgi:RNA polymerase subunit RPABC4/transcription elongation factor Spt4